MTKNDNLRCNIAKSGDRYLLIMDYGVMWNIMIHLNKKTLNSMHKVNKLANRICKDKMFIKKYKEQHPFVAHFGPHYEYTDFIIKDDYGDTRDERPHFIVGTIKFTSGQFRGLYAKGAHQITERQAQEICDEFGIKIHTPHEPYRDCQNGSCNKCLSSSLWF